MKSLPPTAQRGTSAATTLIVVALGGGCREVRELDERTSYLGDVDYRRDVLERDLTGTENDYAQHRLALYGFAGEGWEVLPEVDLPSRPLRVEETGAGEATSWGVDDTLTTLVPEELPTSEEGWVELGRRVFFEYPLHADPVLEEVARAEGGLASVGFEVEDGAFVGVRIFRGSDGTPRLGPTCAQCHASRDEGGVVTGVRANKRMDVGAAKLLALGLVPTELPNELPNEIDSTEVVDLARLGPGRTDVLNDGTFNPFAIPDFGGIADLPYLQHNANWRNARVTTLAIRCETLFITASRETTRIPRELTWALATYLRSLPPPPPASGLDAGDVARGAALFEEQGCASCHTPPLYTSARSVTVEEIGTDPSALESPSRTTGFVRIPSLRGVASTAPYLHHGAIPDLETLFDPGREEPGHPFGQGLSQEDRRLLVSFLRSL
jgi:mono/diheme cytochrome c family protein